MSDGAASEQRDTERDTERGAPRWAQAWLRAAAIYNLAWGALVITLPNLLFDLAGAERPRYPELWQCVGMIVGVYGVGYWIAAGDPRRHWPIVLVGLLGKVLGPIGFAVALWRGVFPPAFGLTILTNDLVWWVPFAMLLWDAARSSGEQPPGPVPTLAHALHSVRELGGRRLAELCDERATLVVLTRHAGCTFCKEALADLASQRGAIEHAGVGLAIVSMSDEASLRREAERGQVRDAAWCSDPDRVLYRALELRRGRFGELFGLRVWARGVAATLRGHIVGGLRGDGFQMPGAFVIHRGRVVREFRHARASDRPSYCDLAAGVGGREVGA